MWGKLILPISTYPRALASVHAWEHDDFFCKDNIQSRLFRSAVQRVLQCRDFKGVVGFSWQIVELTNPPPWDTWWMNEAMQDISSHMCHGGDWLAPLLAPSLAVSKPSCNLVMSPLYTSVIQRLWCDTSCQENPTTAKSLDIAIHVVELIGNATLDLYLAKEFTKFSSLYASKCT